MSAPLQQEIGRTEQALSALLLEVVLKDALITSSDEWVAVNVVSRESIESGDVWRAVIAESLTAAPERVVGITSRLVESGGVRETPQGLTLSDELTRELVVARRKAAYVGAEVDRQLSEADRAATVRALHVVRDVVRSIRERGFPRDI